MTNDCEHVFTVKRGPCFIFVEQKEQENEPSDLVSMDQMSKIIYQIKIKLVTQKETFTGTKGKTNESEEISAKLVPENTTLEDEDVGSSESLDEESSEDCRQSLLTSLGLFFKNVDSDPVLEKKGEHECEHCGITFSRRKDMLRHVDSHHRRPVQDESTEKMLNQSGELKDTMEREKSTVKKKKNYRTIKKLEKQHQCPVCGQSCKTLKDLDSHVKQHEKWCTGEQCSVCDKFIIGSKETFQQHIQTHTALKTTEIMDSPIGECKIETTEEKPHVCKICDKAFRLKPNLKAHVEIHLDEKKYRCVTCGKRFNTSSQLSMHKQTHRTVKKFVCDLCGRGFKLQANFKAHIATHLNEKRHECKVCGKRFNTSSQISMHRKIHLEVKLFTCEFCGRAFKTRPNFREHIKIHLNERQHVCNICGRGFNTNSALSGHRRTHSEKKTDNGEQQCTVCNETIKEGKLAFRKHMKTHPADYPCNSCTKRFSRKSNLKRHLEVHSNVLHECDQCDKAFNTTAKLTKHIRSVHKAEETPNRKAVAMPLVDQTLSL